VYKYKKTQHFSHTRLKSLYLFLKRHDSARQWLKYCVLLKINYCCLWWELLETQTNTPCLYNAGISVWMQVGNPVNTLLYLFQMCTKRRRGEARWGAAMWCTTFNVIGGQRGFYCVTDPRHWPRRPSGKCSLNTRWSAGKWSRVDEKMLDTWEGFGVWSAGCDKIWSRLGVLFWLVKLM
jgi:hypothetical protein